VKPSSNDQLSNCCWSFNILDLLYRYKIKNIVGPLIVLCARYGFKLQVTLTVEFIFHCDGCRHSTYQQNVNRSGSHTQTSQTFQVPSPVLLSTSGCPQATLELCKVISDSAKAISATSGSTCSYGGAFRMLRDLTIRIVKFWSSQNRCAAMRETWCRTLTAVVLR